MLNKAPHILAPSVQQASGLGDPLNRIAKALSRVLKKVSLSFSLVERRQGQAGCKESPE